MRRHPAGSFDPYRRPSDRRLARECARLDEAHRVARLVSDAQDQQALDLANRGHVDAELFAGGPLRQVNEQFHSWATGPRRALVGIAGPFAAGLLLFLLIFGTAVLGEIAGGWPT